jgi:hypothetical protein
LLHRVDFAWRRSSYNWAEIQAPLTSTRQSTAEIQRFKEKIVMKFLSIYKTAERGGPPSQEEIAKMGKLIEEGIKAGFLLSTEGCLPSALGARVRMSVGRVTVTDGPFTEAKEVVGGFAILQANSKEEALKLVKNFLQVAGDGECELRQLYEAGQNTCADAAAGA